MQYFVLAYRYRNGIWLAHKALRVGSVWGPPETAQECIIRRTFTRFILVVPCFLLSVSVWAQTVPTSDNLATKSSSRLLASSATRSAISPGVAVDPETPYTPPSETQKFHDFAWNAFGPVAFAGSSLAAAIDQASNFPHEWGQGTDAYGARVASDLGISLVTATAQYSLAEVFREDTAYYRCSCRGFLPRFWHAALSSTTSRRGIDGHRAFSPALTLSPFIGPLTAANAWIPGRNGPMLGLHMGTYNLLGQLGQDEALEFLYGGPHTLLGRIQHRLFKHSSDPN